MSGHHVQLRVFAPVPFECSFWPENDAWKGFCEELAITVDGDSFEEAKTNMEAEIAEYIRSMLRSRGKGRTAA